MCKSCLVHKTTLTQVMKERSFSSDVVAKEVKFSDVYNVYLAPFQGLYFVICHYLHSGFDNIKSISVSLGSP